MAFDPVQNLNKLYKENPHLISALQIAERLDVKRRRMCWIILHPDNRFPEPKKVGVNGIRRLWCPLEVEAWAKGKDLRSLPFVKNGAFNHWKSKGTTQAEIAKPKKPRGVKNITEIGKGGHAVGSHLKATQDFLKIIGGNHAKR